MRAADPLIPARREAAPIAKGESHPSADPVIEIGVRHATLADHAMIQRFLHVCGLRRTPAEFQAQNEEPGYEPSRRLIAVTNGEPVGHVRLANRSIRFGGVELPIRELADLVVLPEWRSCGIESALIAAAERTARRDGAMFTLVRSCATRLFQQAGWIVGPRHAYSTIGPRRLLAAYRAPPARRPAWLDDVASPAPTVRLWRRMELGAVMRLYEATVGTTVGAPVRDESYWEWLVNRGGCDRLYVAIGGPHRLDPSEAALRIHGYAALRESRIVECAVAADHSEALAALLIRASGDALERDWHPLRIESPPDSPIHALLQSFGGRFFHHDADDGQANLIRLLDPPAFVGEIGGELARRAAPLDMPIELGLLCDRARWKLTVTSRGARLDPDSLGRSYLTLSHHDLVRMLVGRIGARDLFDGDRASTSTKLATDAALTLFPRLPWWIPAWDSLAAGE